MKKLPQTILAWRKKLALLLYPVDITELTRKQLGGISSSDIHYNKDIDDEMRFDARCAELLEDDVLSEIIDKILVAQVDSIARWAKDMDTVAFCRGSINGVSLVKEELERSASRHVERKRQPAEYDRYDVI